MAKFVLAATQIEQYPQHDLFECCLIGRSNVGKSSLINALAKAKIAYISKQPGRTRTINFYDFNRFYLVDLPGYGYAKMTKQNQKALAEIAETYLYYREQLMSVVHVCDINVITALDVEMKDYLRTKFDNYLLCLSKADRLSYAQQQKRLQLIAKQMNLALESILLVSAKKQLHTTQLFSVIQQWTSKK